MNHILGCLSEGKLFVSPPGGGETEIKSPFVDGLRERLQSVKDRREWKMSGTGAQFARGGLPTGPTVFDVDRFHAQFSAACVSPEPGCILYAIDAGDVHGIFSFSLAEREEQRLLHGPSRRFSWLQSRGAGGEVIVAVSQQDGTGCIGLMRSGLSGGVREITEGDAIDAYPAWIPGDRRCVVYQSSGIARRNGRWAGLGPAMLQRLDLESGELDTLLHDEKSDLLCPTFGPAGELYFIQRPYEAVALAKPHHVLKDLVLFPFRLVRAIFGFLNVFSLMFSGKPLKTAGGPPREGPDPKAVFLYGRWVNVQQELNKAQPDESVSAVPKSWVLKRCSAGNDPAAATTVASGVMAYTVAADGTLYYSTGRAVFCVDMPDSRHRKISSRPLVTCLFAAPVVAP